MRAPINSYGLVGFGLAAVIAGVEKWSLPEFCWSTWLAGLGYSWACVLTASLQIILTARTEKGAYEVHLPFLRRVSPSVFVVGVTVISVAVGLIAFRAYAYLFGFYGLFLSLFAEMEPLDLFGRNGFINSDFITPLMYLFERFWPMAVGVLITNWRDLILRQPWKRLAVPFQRQMLRMHVMVLALPVLSLLAWAIFGESYQPVTIVLLMGLLFLLPKKGPRDDSEIDGSSDHGSQIDAE